jgi:hypothetical protein
MDSLTRIPEFRFIKQYLSNIHDKLNFDRRFGLIGKRMIKNCYGKVFTNLFTPYL